ncbi:MAG: dihydrofolate reductase [Zoogloeaceae bacterium]|jgi:dihydrofolate reductase|nr:dihydrofolate reductase [Zoogloeaceae bacterium]
MNLTLIAALAHNRVIGQHNALPWHLPEDLAHFKALTLGHPVLMGRKTWDSLPAKFRPLPGRKNVVVSARPDFVAPGAQVASSLPEALALLADEAQVFVIGGQSLYAQALPLADALELTEIAQDFEGDAWFPEFFPEDWQEVARKSAISASGLPFAFVRYHRRSLGS